MQSLISGYEYDIFISYRQKDNRGERWVNTFVDTLRTELEATYKDNVSVYFDENPGDSLKETHNVNKSLEAKLKCLIFIPILSATYCDPESYAWQNEFLAFIKLSREDKLGADIKLRNGNYASRILPIRIYDLEEEDVRLFEKEAGIKLRALDFVFKTSSGVNRPLRVNEDHPTDNLNKTYYLDQINKLANAIIEIYRGLKNERNALAEEKTKNNESDSQLIGLKGNLNEGKKPVNKKSKRKLMTISSVILFLLVGVFAVFRILNPGEQDKSLPEIEKSIAVLPFLNDSPDEQNTYFMIGIMDEMLTNLQKIKDFTVLSKTSTEGFTRNGKQTIPELAKKIGANYLVEGSGQKFGRKFILRVKLIEAKSEKQLWGRNYDKEIQTTSDIISIQIEIAQAIAKELKAILTPEEKQIIGSQPTMDLTAYDFYFRAQGINVDGPMGANREAVKNAEFLYKKAIERDSTFALAYTGLAGLYWIRNNFNENISKNLLDSMLIYANIGLSYDAHRAEAYLQRAGYYAERTGNLNKALEELDKALRINPNSWETYHERAKYYEWSGDLIKTIENREKAASLNRGTKLPELLGLVGESYLQAGFPVKANEYNLEALNLSGDSIQYLMKEAYSESLIAGNFIKAIGILTRVSQLDSTANVDLDFGINYMFLSQYKESLQHFKRFEEKMKASGAAPYFSISDLIGYVLWQNGYKKEGESYFNRQIDYCKSSIKSRPFEQSVCLMNFELAGIYAFRGEKERAYVCLKIFNQMSSYALLDLINLKINPLLNSLRNEPEFMQIEKEVEAKYQAEHERVRKWLAEQPSVPTSHRRPADDLF